MIDRSNLGLVRIARETVQERVYAALSRPTHARRLEPGQKLKIADLARAFWHQFDAGSRSPQSSGCGAGPGTLPSRTVRVPALSMAALQDLREARFAIEGLAISRAASKMTPESLATLERFTRRRPKRYPSMCPKAARGRIGSSLPPSIGSRVPRCCWPIIESLWLQFGPYLRAASERFDGGEGRGINSTSRC